MLPSELLRVKIKPKGKIYPLFCGWDKEDDNNYLSIAKTIIKEFQEAQAKKEKKSELINRIRAIEAAHADYKLIRGLYTILERRCIFLNNTIIQIEKDSKTRTSRWITESPYSIRKKIFEESSTKGFAISETDRYNIINTIAKSMGRSFDELNSIMWEDLDENQILHEFKDIEAIELLYLYNISILQTLLFKSIKMEFSLKGGYHWKRVLRRIKQLKLMYNLEHRKENQDNNIICTVDGPMSIFKQTDRYGTALAKLVPEIIDSDNWMLKTWIIRTTESGKRIYDCDISSNEYSFLSKRLVTNEDNSIADNLYDSKIEQKFLQEFKAFDSGWEIIREPDPLIVEGKAFIVDFLCKKYGINVYIEIIGFWTEDYIERKTNKIIRLYNGKDTMRNNYFILLINNDYQTLSINNSHKVNLSRLYDSQSFDGKIFFYANGNISTKNIVLYLKEIERRIIEKDYEIRKKDIEKEIKQILLRGGFYSIDKIANEYNIAKETVKKILYDINDQQIVLLDNHFAKRNEISEYSKDLEKIISFDEAYKLLEKKGVPETAIIPVISTLGYKIEWNGGIDFSKAILCKSIKEN